MPRAVFEGKARSRHGGVKEPERDAYWNTSLAVIVRPTDRDGKETLVGIDFEVGEISPGVVSPPTGPPVPSCGRSAG